VKVLICGSRDFTDEDTMRKVIASLPADTEVIHGAARGADSMADRLAKERGLTVLPYPANWGQHGRAAGMIRNRKMLEEGRPDIVYAFFAGPEMSPGTANMVKVARKAGVAVKEYVQR